MFETSHPFPLFEDLRVPYVVVPDDDDGERLPGGFAWLRSTCDEERPRLHWPSPQMRGMSEPMEHRLNGLPLFAGVVPDDVSSPWLLEAAAGWRPWLPITDVDGRRVASVWLADDDSVFLPFAPGDATANIVSERYEQIVKGEAARHRQESFLHLYYRLRPLIPRGMQLALRRAFARIQARRKFPAWPRETALHDLYDLLLGLTTQVAGGPVPYIAPWPEPFTWALVLTHDVEQQPGFDAIDSLLDIERAAGYRSCVHFVPRRYRIDEGVLVRLRHDGFEVGVHGLYHDGRDLESEARLRERLPMIHEAARRWESVGFRSPATHRHWELMPLLGFDYDSSYPDTDPFEPYGGGCCRWLPFFNGNLLELPITLVQDFTLFVILRREDESAWVDKADFLRERGGMALLLTHPDYLLDPERRASYARFLIRYAEDATAWRALPREVSAWWRRRAASSLVQEGDDWMIDGPAAGEGQVVYAVQSVIGSGRVPV